MKKLLILLTLISSIGFGQTKVPANTVLAGPTSGPNAAATYRALMGVDLPTTKTINGASLIGSGDISVSIPTNRIDQNNASTTSAQLATTISDEIGTGNLVFSGALVAYPLTTKGDIFISTDNSGTAGRLGIGTTGQVLTTSASGLPSWADASSAGWQLTGTSTFTGSPTIAQGGNTLTWTSTLGFNPAQTLWTMTNNASEIWNVSTSGAQTFKVYNTSGTETGRALITGLSGTIGLRLQNSSVVFDYGYNAASNYAYMANNTAANTKFLIGVSGVVPSAVFQVRSSSTGPIIRFEDGSGNNGYQIDASRNHAWGQLAQSTTNTFLSFTQAAHTAGVNPIMTLTGGAVTGITNGQSLTEINYALNRSIQWSGNNPVTTYRGMYIQAPTLASTSVGATVATGATFSISGAPVSGTNMSVTAPYAFNVESGASRFNGAVEHAYVAKTALYTLTAADYTVEVTSGTHTQTLPTAVGITGRKYVITNSGTGVVTVGTTSSQTFVNVSGTPTTLTLNQFQTVIVQSNGANWLRISTI